MTTLQIPVTSADHAEGEAGAPVTLVEYGDYECPACGAAYPTVKAVQKHFGKKLKFVFRNFPLTKLHPHAESAAEVAEFAGARARFWEMHDGLYENQDGLDCHSISRWRSLWICPRRNLPRRWSSMVSGRRCAPTSREGSEAV